MTYDIFSGHFFQITGLGAASGISWESFLGVMEILTLFDDVKRLLFLFSGFRIHRLFFFFQNRKKCIYFILFIFILSYDVTILTSLILQPGVQGLQAFAFCILTVNDEHSKQT